MKDINANPVKFSELTDGKNCIVFTYPKMGESGKFLPENLKPLYGCKYVCRVVCGLGHVVKSFYDFAVFDD